MELYQLRTFLMVAEEGNLTRASERLFTSQPAISAQIKALEEEWDVRLFLRSPKGMTLTAEGEVLRRKAELVVSAARELASEAGALRGEIVGSVRIGVNTDGDLLRLSALLESLAGSQPRLELRFIQDVSGNILDALRHGRMEAGFFFGELPWPELEAITLGEIPFVVAAPRAWKERVVGRPWRELATLPWVFPVPECPYTQIHDRLFGDGQESPARVAYASSESAMDSLVKAGSGLALMRADQARRAEEKGEIVIWEGGRFTLPLRFGHLAAHRREPLIQAVRDAVTAIWPGAGNGEELAQAAP